MYRFFGLFVLLLPILASLVFPTSVTADGTEFGMAIPNEKWSVTTRWDYRVRIDGRYLGFANRELRELYQLGEEIPLGWSVSGDARMLGNTKKDGMPVAARLQQSDSASFILSRDGSVLEAGNSFPRLRGFPTFPPGPLIEGDIWEAPLDILVFGPGGQRGILPQIASYRYLGMKPYSGRPAHYFEVQWALRYRGGDFQLDGFLDGVEGSHKVSLVLDGETLAPIMARDTLSEQWRWSDSTVEQRDGFALIFWKGIPPLDKGGIRREFEERFPGELTDDDNGGGSRVDDGMLEGGSEGILYEGEETELDESSGDDIIIRETERGLSVTLRNLHFKPDLAEFVPGEERRLDELASILNDIPDRTVLVRGHTADVGRPQDELNLSEERAKLVADEMADRGVDPRRLVYEGVGAREPVATNGTEEGRRLNRRVELLILED